MTTAEQLKILCIQMNISMSELARRIGQSPQNFSAKLKRGTITDTDLVKIADVLNILYEQSFILPDGKKIQLTNEKRRFSL
jgi:transcriptional regulator with XRE-family HTH domain